MEISIYFVTCVNLKAVPTYFIPGWFCHVVYVARVEIIGK